MKNRDEVEVGNLIEYLVQQLGVTTPQAEGGAGLLLCLAQHKMSDDDFLKVADAIPAISDIMGKAPRYEAKITGPVWAKLSQVFGGLGGLTFLVAAFSILGLDKAMLTRFVTALLDYFGLAAGAEVESLLKAVLR